MHTLLVNHSDSHTHRLLPIGGNECRKMREARWGGGGAIKQSHMWFVCLVHKMHGVGGVTNS